MSHLSGSYELRSDPCEIPKEVYSIKLSGSLLKAILSEPSDISITFPDQDSKDSLGSINICGSRHAFHEYNNENCVDAISVAPESKVMTCIGNIRSNLHVSTNLDEATKSASALTKKAETDKSKVNLLSAVPPPKKNLLKRLRIPQSSVAGLKSKLRTSTRNSQRVQQSSSIPAEKRQEIANSAAELAALRSRVLQMLASKRYTANELEETIKPKTSALKASLIAFLEKVSIIDPDGSGKLICKDLKIDKKAESFQNLQNNKIVSDGSTKESCGKKDLTFALQCQTSHDSNPTAAAGTEDIDLINKQHEKFLAEQRPSETVEKYKTIETPEIFQQYCQEFNLKRQRYLELNAKLKSNREDFVNLSNQLQDYQQSKKTDSEEYLLLMRSVVDLYKKRAKDLVSWENEYEDLKNSLIEIKECVNDYLLKQ